ncbi:hypothetical protein [Pseudobacteriovorax antillogorgiicola]|uniref:Uncharacterized protein n=1 Tax=Pseudobacteriovorax antillogorgiicola TaxID=1513793 RepID=A0A1Y6BZW3_9BACT|nr:hypothetical protein [Pseudobacteriovorax antillogorgiicola]TCS51136.1 hypothetical protein EDD56_11117 [Pseudobacteriovorax antillogorgiicola]SMF38411.1 hypothetical protein SAMN06296036_111160 [Pseudobacteriovorax antillogorgiicola]
MKAVKLSTLLIALPLGTSTHATPTNTELAQQLTQMKAKLALLEDQINNGNRRLELKPERDGQVFSKVAVDNIDLITVHTNPRADHGLKVIIESLEGGQQNQILTIFKNHRGGSLKIPHKETESTGNFDNRHSEDIILQGSYQRSARYIKIGNSWQAIDVPEIYSMNLESNPETGISYTSHHGRTSTLSLLENPGNLVKSADGILALKQGRLYINLEDLPTLSCILASDESDGIKLTLSATDMGNSYAHI